MQVFQVRSRLMQPRSSIRRRSRVQWWMYALLQRVLAVLVVTTIAFTLGKVGFFNLFFLLLPIGMSIVVSPGQLSRLLHGTFLYAILTICLAFLYYLSVTAIEIFIHTPGFGLLAHYHGPPVALFIVVTTTLTWAIILAPLYTFVQ